MKKNLLFIVLVISPIFLYGCNYVKDSCDFWYKETRIYYDNWSLKEKWCMDEQWLFSGLVSLYNENGDLQSEWYMENNQPYLLWT